MRAPFGITLLAGSISISVAAPVPRPWNLNNDAAVFTFTPGGPSLIGGTVDDSNPSGDSQEGTSILNSNTGGGTSSSYVINRFSPPPTDKIPVTSWQDLEGANILPGVTIKNNPDIKIYTPIANPPKSAPPPQWEYDPLAGLPLAAP